jgi:hypothetical protein
MKKGLISTKENQREIKKKREKEEALWQTY